MSAYPRTFLEISSNISRQLPSESFPVHNSAVYHSKLYTSMFTLQCSIANLAQDKNIVLREKTCRARLYISFLLFNIFPASLDYIHTVIFCTPSFPTPFVCKSHVELM
jgi:hypothetical protein